ncbi:hypothetical protein FH115_10590 [Staphylococcus hominis]|uniref:hypothetical protein n=1 Tax=Staphylococcus hominis TaxID=1290 RepID=UPI001F571CE5|nr:hypothetical protein [Staphylococcus hominis]MCI2870106.1 hypothetical protein [Staphylococcus hominis]MDS3894677.1 hypothetical protein [Staphylococcus hominis]
MIEPINYFFKNMIRSYKFIAPYSVFVLIVVILYYYSGQPVLSSFGTTSMLLLFISIWLNLITFDLESVEELQLLLMQLGRSLYLTSKLIFNFLMTVPLIIFAIIYPLVSLRFEHLPSLTEILIGIHAHIIISITAIILTALFKYSNFLSKKYSWLLLILISLLAILKSNIIKEISTFKYISFILPPISEMLNYLNQQDTSIFNSQFLIVNIWYCVHIVFFIIIIYIIFNRKDIIVLNK